MLGIHQFPDERAKNAFSNAVHRTHGASWGTVRGLLGALGLPPLAASALHFAAVLAQ